MRGELIALDLETTGLNPAYDDIIEIGAVKFEGERIIDELAILVKPTRPIPPIVTQLTGIEPEDVENAPPIADALPRLTEFVGRSPWIAHNASFDGAFLERLGALRGNLRIDTFDLAPLLLPQSPRYNLTSLTQTTGFAIESAHRALYDARATAHVYWKLWEKLVGLPLPVIMEMAALARDSHWDVLPIFEGALREHGVQTLPERFERAFATPSALFEPYQAAAAPLERIDPPLPISTDETTALLDENSPLAAQHPGYERRSGQIEMAGAIADAFNESFHLLIEAGTGVGKSLGYLVPAALWALRNGERVVVSTNTITLQEQLLTHDLPLLQSAVGEPLRAALLKGRGNYLCPRRFIEARRTPPATLDEARMIAKLLVWLSESRSGDRSEINLRGGDEQFAWSHFSAEGSDCGSTPCHGTMQGVCPFYKAQQAAENAHIVIVNHALLIADAAAENPILPPFSRVILDEGHQLEDALTNALSFKLDADGVRRALNDAEQLLQLMVAALRAGAPAKDADRFTAFVAEISTALRLMQKQVTDLFAACGVVVREANQHEENYAMVRLSAEVRAMNAFAHVQTLWSTLRPYFETISEAMRRAGAALRRLSANPIPNLETLTRRIDASAYDLSQTQRHLEALLTANDDNAIHWFTAGTQEPGYLSVHGAPLNVGALMEKHIWDAKASVIVTSATLQANGSFEFIQQRLRAESVGTLEIPSPFNYRDSALVLLPTDIPEPNERERYQLMVERAVIELASALNGRTMVLFTSYAHLRQTAQAITPRLALGNITVYDQSDGTSRQALLEGFRTSEKAVLLGTKSFWEGVDIPGSTLSAIVIPRLPFMPPNDPIFAGRADAYADHFNEYAVPDAVLRFRQGFGRLIRTQTDRGVVVILDARVRTKRYGSSFLEALPDCTTQSVLLSGLADAAVKWIKRGTN